MTKEKVNEDWKTIFEKFVDVSKDINLISTKTISENSRSDLRFMTKFDTFDSQPDDFKEYGYFILPLKNGGNFVLVKGDGFHKLEPKEKPKKFISRLKHDLISLTIGTSEMKYLDYAYHTGLLEDFLGIGGLKLTIRGRKRTPEFSFLVGNIGPLNVSRGVQMEVDGGFENVGEIVLFEVKSKVPNDFNIRQLFYPYRSWIKFAGSKTIIPVFFAYDDKNKTYNFWRYSFTNNNQYNSIKLEDKGTFIITTPAEKRLTVAEVSKNKEGKKLVKGTWKIPQADDFEKVSVFPFLVARGIDNSKKVSKDFGFSLRQSSYYRDAVEILGLVRLNKKNTYELTKIGKKYVNMNTVKRNILLSSLLFKMPIIKMIINKLMKENKISFSEISNIIVNKSKCNRTTANRRSRTIVSWFKWIQKNLGIVEVKKKMIKIS